MMTAGEIDIDRNLRPSHLDPMGAREVREWAKELYDDARVRAWARFPKWARNAALYHGEHYGRSTPYGFLPESIFDESLEPVAREKHNYIRAFVNAAIADVLRNFPQPEVVARNNDPLAISQAEFAHRMTRSWVYTGVVSFEHLYRTELSAKLFGGGFYKVTFDPFLGRRLTMPDGSPSSMYEGEISMRSVDLFDAIPNPDATCSEDVDYVFHRQLMPRRRLDARFPVDIYGEPTKGKWEIWNLSVEQGERDLVQRSNDLGAFWPSNKSQANEMCEVIEFWHKPSPESPDGVLLKFSGDAIIYAGPLPFEWPWVYRHGPNLLHSEMISDGMVDDLEGPQRALNDMMSQVREWIREILRPPIMAPRGSEMSPGQWDTVMGRVVEYNYGYRPEWMPTPPVPQSLLTSTDGLIASMKDISTYSDVSRGKLTPGAESGKAVGLLHELERNVHGPDIQFFRLGIVQIFKIMLHHAQQFYPEERGMAILGDDNSWTSVPFRRAEIDFDALFVIEPFNGPPMSRAIRNQEILDGAALGLFADLPPSEIRKMMGYASLDRSLSDPKDLDRAEARRENFEFLSNPFAQLEVVLAEDHDTHIDTHNQIRKSSRYKGLPPALRAIIDQHVAAHEMARYAQLVGYGQESGMLAPARAGPPPPAGGGGRQPSDGGAGSGVGAAPGGLPMASQ